MKASSNQPMIFGTVIAVLLCGFAWYSATNARQPARPITYVCVANHPGDCPAGGSLPTKTVQP